MTGPEVCRYGGRKKENGNCEHPDADGFAVQSVGPWVDDKHDQLRTYLEATHAVRAKFIAPSKKGGVNFIGGAAFIDLFAGPGRVRVRNRKTTQKGSALIAAHHKDAAFSKLILCDVDPENVASLRNRTSGDTRVLVVNGDCNERIADIVASIPEHGLNIALIDPFGPKALKWATVEKLGQFKRMDLLIHFPTNAIKRNFLNDTINDFEDVIDGLVGTDNWRDRVRKHGEIVTLIEILRERLVTLGYDQERVRALPIKNTQGGLLYHLMFASKDRLGTQIWKSLTRHTGKQRGFDL